MKSLYRFIFLLVLSGIIFTACSRKKDTFISRNYHAVTTEFNTLYNGEVALEKGKATLIETFEDNYWEVLPIERIAFAENTAEGTENRDANFSRAEEKAIKAIQRHAMQIDGEERNPQIDEAFLLLGKARYYDQQFIPALEAFNYILAYYPKSNNITQAKIWKEKTNIRLDNNIIAVKNLNEIFAIEDDLKDQDIADAHAMLAQAYLNLEKPDSALVFIKSAANLTKKREEQGRYNFIKGQLYNKSGKIDSANLAFQEVIELNRKIPRKYHINAHLEQIRNFDYNEGDTLLVRERLDALANNRENRPYLDRIYYAKGNYFQKIGKEDSAIANFNKSLLEKSSDPFLNSRNYLALATYNFDKASYTIAGAYYDSVLSLLPDRTREYRAIRKKRANLTDVIGYENLAARNDSILKLATMSDEAITSYFEAYIEKLKAQATQDSLDRVERVRNQEFFNSNSGSRGREVVAAGEFYFYNDVAVSYGKLAFEKQWGKRRLEDNWRTSTKQATASNNNALQGVATQVDAEQVPFKTATDYIATVPREPMAIDSMVRERDVAYFQLGLIYKEKFKEYQLAIDKLEGLIAFKPDEKLVLPAKYNLYQLYTGVNAFAKAESIKSDIVSNYPNSRYAQRITNPDIALAADTESAEEVYKRLYKLFSDQDFAQLLPALEQRIEQFYGDPYLPKFELLKATALGRYKGYDAYKTALNFVALTYPRTEEGKKAQSLLENALPDMAFSGFEDENLSISFKLLYPFDQANIDGAAKFEKKLLEIFEKEGYDSFDTSIDIYTADTTFVVVHNFTSKSRVEGLVEYFEKNEALELGRKSIIMASENYKIIQLHKNIAAYEAQLIK